MVLLNDVSDHAENYTRFVSVANHTRIDRDGGRCGIRRCAFVTHHHPGALLSAIEPLARFGVNMVSLQSRPIPGRPWSYQFYADLEGHPLDAAVATALRALEENVAEMATWAATPRSSATEPGEQPRDGVRRVVGALHAAHFPAGQGHHGTAELPGQADLRQRAPGRRRRRSCRRRWLRARGCGPAPPPVATTVVA